MRQRHRHRPSTHSMNLPLSSPQTHEQAAKPRHIPPSSTRSFPQSHPTSFSTRPYRTLRHRLTFLPPSAHSPSLTNTLINSRPASPTTKDSLMTNKHCAASMSHMLKRAHTHPFMTTFLSSIQPSKSQSEAWPNNRQTTLKPPSLQSPSRQKVPREPRRLQKGITQKKRIIEQRYKKAK